MRSRLADRLLTIVATATLTSAVWIVIGSAYLEPADDDSAEAPLVDAPLAEAPVGEAPASDSSPPAATPSPPAAAPSLPARSQVSQLIIPVLDVSADELTDSFADGRDGGERLHQALDIMAPAGTTVVAAAPGTIERLFDSAAGGNTIYVRSPDRETIHYYAHLQEYAPGLQEGQMVRRGQRLGAVGSTGNASGDAPHLHFAIMRTTPDAEWWEPAQPLNPYPLLGGR